jgi:hypothetical protein
MFFHTPLYYYSVILFPSVMPQTDMEMGLWHPVFHLFGLWQPDECHATDRLQAG